MDLSAIFNWPGITLCVSAVSAAWCFVKTEALHKRCARFDIAVTKIYSALERYINAANKVRVNINTLPLEYLLEYKSDKLDEWVTSAVYELENTTLLTEMFFNYKDRVCFTTMVDATRSFNYELHKAHSASSETEKINIYDRARTAYNKNYDSAMSCLVDMVNAKLLGEWEYDIAKLRVPLSRHKLKSRMQHQ